MFWHAVVGAALAGAVWSVGLALVGHRSSALDGYAVGLLAATAAAFAWLVHPAAGGAALLVVLLAAVSGAHAVRAAVASLGRGVARGFAPAVALGGSLGLLLHGPTDELDSAAFGDMLFYVDRHVSATQSVVPYRDLLIEGESIVYVESAPSFIGAALDPLALDPVLVQTTLFPAFLVVALTVGVALMRTRATVLAAMLLAGAVAYPSWVTETPPAALALPLAFSLYAHLVERYRPLVVGAVGVMVGVDLMLTKVLGLIPAAVVLGAILLTRSGRTGRERLVRVALPLALAGVATITALVVLIPWQASLAEAKVLPLEAVRSIDTLSAAAVAPAATVVAQALVLGALAAARLWVPAAAVGGALVGFWFAHRYNFDIALGMAMLLAGLLIARARPGRERVVAIAAAALLASAALRELLGVRTGVALLAALLVAFAPRQRLAYAAAAATFVAALALGGGSLRPFHATLTTEDYDIWRRVSETVPRDGLVFTTLTGPRVLPYEGWHNYPSIAGRQLYLAGWYDSRLVSDESDRTRRLRLNASVVRHGRPPDSVPLERGYRSFWLVIGKADDPPAGVTRVYANERFELYRFGSASTLR